MGRDLAGLFDPPPPGGAQQLAYRQATVVAFDQSTLENTVDVGGTRFEDLPLLGVAEADTLAAGSVVGLMWTGFEYAIIGRLVRPATDDAADAVNRLARSITSGQITAPGDTSSTSYGDLSVTVGPIVPTIVKSSGLLLIALSADITSPDTGVASGGLMACQVVNGATGVVEYAAGTLPQLHFMYSDNAAHAVGDSLGATRLFLVRNLAPATYTVTAKYAAESGGPLTTFANTNVTCIPL